MEFNTLCCGGNNKMITSIKELCNLGRYEKYIGNQVLGNKQIIFGFNGTGKSTLSDMFYSLSNNSRISSDRKTLDKDDGTKAGDIKVVLGTDTEDVTYLEEKGWDKSLNIYTFNEQYIKDYVFVNREYNKDVVPITIGTEGVRLSNLKQTYVSERKDNLDIINSIIKDNRELCGDLGLGKVALKADNIKRLEAMKILKLFPISEKDNVEAQLNKNVESEKDVVCINNCIELASEINFRRGFISVTELRKILERIPTVKNREINQHMKNCMKHDNIKWLVAGYYNQANMLICPYCGQEITSEEAKKLIKELNKFVSTKMQIKAKKLIQDARQKIQTLNIEEINNTIDKCNEILINLKNNNLITSRSYKEISTNIEELGDFSPVLSSLLQKLWEKVENPYIVMCLEENEIFCINTINKIFRRISRMESELRIVYDNLVKKIKSEKEMKKKEALCEVSFGSSRTRFIDLKNAALQVLKLNEKIYETSVKLDDVFNQVKLDKINDILRELNIKFTLNVEGRQYYIKLRNYVPQKYDKDNNSICSEGEKRILAFAYFLTELSDNNDKKIIVIDDPITSLDLSRKSVIAYRISELFNSELNQTIVMTHDISFVEQIKELSMKVADEISMIELKNKQNIFRPLNIQEYLISEEKVYSSFISNVNEFSNETDRIIAFMSLRPYTYIVDESGYENIRNESTYFAHTIYSQNKNRNIEYKLSQYNEAGLKKYIGDVMQATGLEVNIDTLVPEGYVFGGFDYRTIKRLYNSISIENVVDARKKAMLLRVYLEACLYQLTTKIKFNPERIGKEYNNVIKSCSGEKKKMAKKLKELYDLSKKYHHGAEEGSTLGLSYINPDEMEFFETELKVVVDWIDNNCTIRERVA